MKCKQPKINITAQPLDSESYPLVLSQLRGRTITLLWRRYNWHSLKSGNIYDETTIPRILKVMRNFKIRVDGEGKAGHHFVPFYLLRDEDKFCIACDIQDYIKNNY